MPASDETSHSARVRALLGGQLAPPVATGGLRILYRCRTCGNVWLMNGAEVRLRLTPDESTALAGELAADLGTLPYATCRICLASDIGEFSLDEYGAGAGYGLSIELVEPPGGHLLGSVVRADWMQRQAKSQRPPRASVVTDFSRCRAWLDWLAALPSPLSYQPITSEQATLMARDNPPGHRALGTEGWRWAGGIWLAPCPPLGGRTLISLAQALPPNDVFSMPAMLETWRLLARICLAGRMAGEVEP